SRCSPSGVLKERVAFLSLMTTWSGMSLFGPTIAVHFPWSLARSPFGSSAGAGEVVRQAAAIRQAARIAFIGVGSWYEGMRDVSFVMRAAGKRRAAGGRLLRALGRGFILLP